MFPQKMSFQKSFKIRLCLRPSDITAGSSFHNLCVYFYGGQWLFARNVIVADVTFSSFHHQNNDFPIGDLTIASAHPV